MIFAKIQLKPCVMSKNNLIAKREVELLCLVHSHGKTEVQNQVSLNIKRSCLLAFVACILHYQHFIINQIKNVLDEFVSV